MSTNLDFDRRIYTACQEVREGGIGEIEVEEVTALLDGTEVRTTVVVRREVRHINMNNSEGDI